MWKIPGKSWQYCESDGLAYFASGASRRLTNGEKKEVAAFLHEEAQRSRLAHKRELPVSLVTEPSGNIVQRDPSKDPRVRRRNYNPYEELPVPSGTLRSRRGHSRGNSGDGNGDGGQSAQKNLTRRQRSASHNQLRAPTPNPYSHPHLFRGEAVEHQRPTAIVKPIVTFPSSPPPSPPLLPPPPSPPYPQFSSFRGHGAHVGISPGNTVNIAVRRTTNTTSSPLNNVAVAECGQVAPSSDNPYSAWLTGRAPKLPSSLKKHNNPNNPKNKQYRNQRPRSVFHPSVQGSPPGASLAVSPSCSHTIIVGGEIIRSPKADQHREYVNHGPPPGGGRRRGVRPLYRSPRLPRN